MWRRGRTATITDQSDNITWARTRTQDWFSRAERDLKDERVQREEENVLKFRVDDGWNVRALWTGRVKSLLVSAGVSVSPVLRNAAAPVSVGGIVARSSDADGGVSVKRWTGSVGVSVAYST